MANIKIPHLAEGVESGTVVSILVKEGDKVKKDQTVAELETKKAVAPIQSPFSGTVSKILVKVGDEISVGQAIIALAEEGVASSSEPAAPLSKSEPKSSAAASKVTSKTETIQVEVEDYYNDADVSAAPSVRKLARELGIDLRKVKGSERGGRVVVADIKAYIQRLEVLANQPKASAGQSSSSIERPTAVSVDFSKWGSVTKKPMSQLRKAVSEAMSASWATIPHVTQFDEADITDLMVLRKQYAPDYEAKKTRLTLSSFALKVVIEALKKYPVLNSSIDESKHEIVYKNYYNIGVAVDTDAGLIVPVLKSVDQKSVFQLSVELGELAEKTRQRKISLDDVQGGTFTISNLGSIGGTHFTPIVNKPEVAILGLGQGVWRAVVKNKKIEQRLMLPVCVSYDHRAVDGADGARFIREIVTQFENFKESDLKITSEKKEEKKKAKVAVGRK